MDVAVTKPERSLGKKYKRTHVAVAPQLLTRASLDGRTNAAKAFDAMVAAIYADLGGVERLSTMQRGLVEAYVGSAIIVDDLNAQRLMGRPADAGRHTQAVNTMVRCAKTLGLERVPPPAPSLADILNARLEPADA